MLPEDVLSRCAEPTPAGALLGDWFGLAAADNDAVVIKAGDRWMASWAGLPVISRLDRTVCTSHPGNGGRPLSREPRGETGTPAGWPAVLHVAASAESAAHSNAWPRHPHQVLPLLSKETLQAQKALALSMGRFRYTSLIDGARGGCQTSSLSRKRSGTALLAFLGIASMP